MTKGKIIGIATTVAIVAAIIFMLTPAGVKLFNKFKYSRQKADDATNYSTLKEVEDTCRSMISSYESDKLIYIQYKDSDNAEKASWAEQAKMRANKTATSYNNYILKNSYIWKDNIPKDIYKKLEIIE